MLKVLGKKICERHTASVTLSCANGFIPSQAKSYILKATIFFTWKIKCQLKITGPFVLSSVERGNEELWVDFQGSQNLFGLKLKKKLLPLITALVIILNHLGVMHLWSLQKMTNCVTPNPLHLQNWTIDFLFKNKTLLLPLLPLLCGSHKCRVPYVFALWFDFFVSQNK